MADCGSCNSEMFGLDRALSRECTHTNVSLRQLHTYMYSWPAHRVISVGRKEADVLFVLLSVRCGDQNIFATYVSSTEFAFSILLLNIIHCCGTRTADIGESCNRALGEASEVQHCYCEIIIVIY
jgi:hypothetical protein